MVTEHRKRGALIFVGIAIVAMLLLAAGFHHLELSPEWHSLSPSQRAAPTPQAMLEPKAIVIPAYLYLAMLIVSLVLMVVIIVAGLISPSTRKHTARNLALILGLTAILIALNRPPETPEPLPPESTSALPFEEVTGPPGEEGATALDLPIAADQPDWMAWGIATALGLLVAGGIVIGGWFLWRVTHPPLSTLEQFAQEAEGALDALRAGADPKDTVMRCYLEMSRVLRRERGITRNQAMTPREFEASLQKAGLPNEPVRQLTRLFETVRYGARAPEGVQGRQAIECLTAIAQACKAEP